MQYFDNIDQLLDKYLPQENHDDNLSFVKAFVFVIGVEVLDLNGDWIFGCRDHDRDDGLNGSINV